MLDIGWSELLIIAVVAIIVIGPKDLPLVMRNLGRAMGAVRRTANEFRVQFEEAVAESEFKDLHQDFEDVRAIHPVSAIKDALEQSLEPVREAAGGIADSIEAGPPGPVKKKKRKRPAPAKKTAAKPAKRTTKARAPVRGQAKRAKSGA